MTSLNYQDKSCFIDIDFHHWLIITQHPTVPFTITDWPVSADQYHIYNSIDLSDLTKLPNFNRAYRSIKVSDWSDLINYIMITK